MSSLTDSPRCFRSRITLLRCQGTYGTNGTYRTMKLTYLSNTFFPFLVPEKDSSFASSVGAQTVYPVGFGLERALQIYWRAQNYQLMASGNGALGGVTQALSVSRLLPPRNQ